jgi:hypothetical protein
MGDLLEGSDTLIAQPTSNGFPRQLPAGLRHAVPPGDAVALCGCRPALVWVGSHWPDADHPDQLCPACRRLALDYVDPPAG